MNRKISEQEHISFTVTHSYNVKCVGCSLAMEVGEVCVCVCACRYGYERKTERWRGRETDRQTQKERETE